MDTRGYLDAVKALTPTGSVYAAAQVLGLKEETVRSWHLARSHPDAYACGKIAELLDLPFEQVLADISAEKEKDPERKAYWESLARKFAACVVMGTAITIGTTEGRSATGPAIPSKAERSLSVALLCTNYATRLLRRLQKALRFRRFPVDHLEVAHS